MKNTTNNTNASAKIESEIQDMVNNCIDKWASELSGANTPINLNIDMKVSGYIGDVKADVTVSGSMNNGAYRSTSKKKHTRNKHYTQKQKPQQYSMSFNEKLVNDIYNKELKDYFNDFDNDIVRTVMMSKAPHNSCIQYLEPEHKLRGYNDTVYFGTLGECLLNAKAIDRATAKKIDATLSDLSSIADCFTIYASQNMYSISAFVNDEIYILTPSETTAAFINKITTIYNNHLQ